MPTQQIGSVDLNTFDRVWEIVKEIGLQERHFNEQQVAYRKMASAWLFATFAAVGFVISETINIGVPPRLLVVGIALGSCAGIYLLWILDLMVYHRLLDSCFIEGLIIEGQHSWLPPMRQNMMETQKGQGVLFNVVGFYMIPMVLLVLVAGVSLALWFSGQGRPLMAVASVAGSVAVGVLIAWVVRSRTGNTARIRQRLKEAAVRNPSEQHGSPQPVHHGE